jgi:hypothetical protein
VPLLLDVVGPNNGMGDPRRLRKGSWMLWIPGLAKRWLSFWSMKQQMWPGGTTTSLLNID